LFGSLCALSFIILRSSLPLAFTDETSVVALASTLMLFAAIFQISDSMQAIAAGLLRGIKDVQIPTMLIAVAYWLIGIPSGYLLAFYFNLGAIGMWLGFIIGLTFSALFLTVRFLKMVKRHLDLP
jgi:MATE family multidrug resistance protein